MKTYKLSLISQTLSSACSVLLAILFTSKYGVAEFGVFSVYNSISVIIFSFFNGCIIVPYTTSVETNKYVGIFDYSFFPLVCLLSILSLFFIIDLDKVYASFMLGYLVKEVVKACLIFNREFSKAISLDCVMLVALFLLFFAEVDAQIFTLIITSVFFLSVVFYGLTSKLNLSRFIENFNLVKHASLYSFVSGGFYELFSRGYNFFIISFPGGDYVNGMLNLTRTIFGVVNMICNGWGRIARVNYSKRKNITQDEVKKAVLLSFVFAVPFNMLISFLSFYLLPHINKSIVSVDFSYLAFWSFFNVLFIVKYVLSTIAQGQQLYKELAAISISFCSVFLTMQVALVYYGLAIQYVLFPVLLCELFLLIFIYKRIYSRCV